MILNSGTFFVVLFIVCFPSPLNGTQVFLRYSGGRVVGGKLAEHKNFPFIVSIQKYKENGSYYGSWSHNCGGSIINRMWILTACHCVAITKYQPLKYKDTRDYRVVAGVTNYQEYNPYRQDIGASEFFAHPRCNRGGYFKPYTYYDAGLILLQSPLEYNLQVQPLKLFSREPLTAVRELRRLQQAHAPCLSPGWGRTKQRPIVMRSPLLKVGNQTLRTAEECHEILCQGKNITEQPSGRCSDLNRIEQVCVTSDDASVCKGDSGGPLVCNGYVFGVVSQVGSSCEFGGLQIFSGITSLLKMINKYVSNRQDWRTIETVWEH